MFDVQNYPALENVEPSIHEDLMTSEFECISGDCGLEPASESLRSRFDVASVSGVLTNPEGLGANPETVKDFCDRLGLNKDSFNALKRKAAKAHPDLDFSPVREGSRTYYVRHADILESLYVPKAPKASEVVEGEVMDTVDLCNGGALTLRKVSYDIELPEIPQTQNYEVYQTDVSAVVELTEAIRAELDARSQAEKESFLWKVANEAVERKAQADLVQMLISQGCSPEQAVSIAKGAKKNA